MGSARPLSKRARSSSANELADVWRASAACATLASKCLRKPVPAPPTATRRNCVDSLVSHCAERSHTRRTHARTLSMLIATQLSHRS